MEKKDLIEYVGERVKIILKNGYYYSCIILSVGDDYVKIRDKNDTTSFIVLEEIKIFEVKRGGHGNTH